MDASEPAVSQPPHTRAGCGCLKGCAIALAVLIVLALAGGLGAWAFGRPWLARRLPAWEASQPLLTPLLGYSGLRARLLPAPDAEALWEERQGGESGRARVPADIFLYPAPLAETYAVSPDTVTGYQRLVARVDAVRAWYLQQMAAQGWELIGERAIDGGVNLAWSKPERTCQIEIISNERGTEVWLRGNARP